MLCISVTVPMVVKPSFVSWVSSLITVLYTDDGEVLIVITCFSLFVNIRPVASLLITWVVLLDFGPFSWFENWSSHAVAV